MSHVVLETPAGIAIDSNPVIIFQCVLLLYIHQELLIDTSSRIAHPPI